MSTKLPDGINYQCDTCGICTDDFKLAQEHINLTGHPHYTKRTVDEITNNIIRTLNSIPDIKKELSNE